MNFGSKWGNAAIEGSLKEMPKDGNDKARLKHHKLNAKQTTWLTKGDVGRTILT